MDFDLLIISVVEGLTEFLPISSTAHLIILSKILSVDLSLSYVKFYLLAIQMGALLAGVFLFSKKIFSNKRLLENVFISFIPSAIIGFALYKVFKGLLEGNMALLTSMLFIGGVIFIYLEKYIIQNDAEFGKTDITKKDAFLVGIAQATAIVPGVSRSGATIVAGVLRGISKETIIEYTFILALPTLGAAVAYDTYKSLDLLTSLENYSGLFIGVFLSFVVALATLYAIKKHIKQISLTAFGIYRILLSLVIFSVYLF
jgi:undecaprenyl-diphosphatase